MADPGAGAAAHVVRPAHADDVEGIVRLAELMYRDLGIELPAERWERWRAAARRSVLARLGADLTVVVAEDPGGAGGLVACGAGSIVDRLPHPSQDDPRVGYIQWMSTEVAHRRRGLARAVLRSLLAWYEAHGVDTVELHASPEGAPLYRSEGFWEGSTGVAMRRRSWDPPPAPGP